MLTVVRGILLPSDHRLGMEKTPVRAGTNFIDHIRLKVDVEGTWHVLSRRRLREESAEAIITLRGRSRVGQTTIRLKIPLYQL